MKNYPFTSSLLSLICYYNIINRMEKSALPSSNWLRNPANNREAYAHHALPQLLFKECNLNCVENGELSAETDSEKLCVKNCQDKTMLAFDLYMRMQHHLEKKRDYRSYIDVSRYTEMEIEHGHDTENVIDTFRTTHINPADVKNFIEGNDKTHEALQSKAFK